MPCPGHDPAAGVGRQEPASSAAMGPASERTKPQTQRLMVPRPLPVNRQQQGRLTRNPGQPLVTPAAGRERLNQSRHAVPGARMAWSQGRQSSTSSHPPTGTTPGRLRTTTRSVRAVLHRGPAAGGPGAVEPGTRSPTMHGPRRTRPVTHPFPCRSRAAGRRARPASGWRVCKRRATAVARRAVAAHQRREDEHQPRQVGEGTEGRPRLAPAAAGACPPRPPSPVGPWSRRRGGSRRPDRGPLPGPAPDAVGSAPAPGPPAARSCRPAVQGLGGVGAVPAERVWRGVDVGMSLGESPGWGPWVGFWSKDTVGSRAMLVQGARPRAGGRQRTNEPYSVPDWSSLDQSTIRARSAFSLFSGLNPLGVSPGAGHEGPAPGPT